GLLDPPNGFSISAAANNQQAPALAFGAANYLVVWQDARSGTSQDIYGSRVSVGAGVLDPAGIAVATSAGDQTVPSVGYMGPNWLVAWQDNPSAASSDIIGTRVAAAGTVLD